MTFGGLLVELRMTTLFFLKSHIIIITDRMDSGQVGTYSINNYNYCVILLNAFVCSSSWRNAGKTL